MGTFSVDNFRSTLTDGLASQSRWRVHLPTLQNHRKVGGGDVSAYPSQITNTLCTSAIIPGKEISTINRQVGLTNIRIAAGFEPGTASLSFYLDNRYILRNYFQDWVDCVVSPTPPFEVGLFKDYKDDVTIHQLDRNEQVRYSVKMVDCYPTNVGEIELNNQPQSAALELRVNLYYKYYVVL